MYSTAGPGITSRVTAATANRASVDELGIREDHHRSQDLVALHLGERLLDLVEGDGLGDEPVEIVAAAQVQVDQYREVAGGQAVAVPGRPQRPAAAVEVEHAQVDPHLRVGDADLDHGPGVVAGVERLLHDLGMADRLDGHVGPEAAGELADGGHRVDLARVDHVGGPELGGQGQLALVDIHGDDLAGPDQGGGVDGGIADPAAAEHGHGVAPLDPGGVHDGPVPGHDPAADQAGRLGTGGRVDLDRLAGGDQADLGEGADADGRGQRGAVLQGHPLAGVAAVKAVPGAAPQAGAALPARRPPGQDHEVARGDVGHVGPDRLHLPGRLVAEQERELVVDRPFAVVQVGVADPAGLHPDQRLPGPRVGHQHGRQLDRCGLGPRDDSAHLVTHGPSSLDVTPRGNATRRGSGQEGVGPQLGLDLGVEAVAGFDPELVAEAYHHGGAGAADLEVDRGLAAVGAEDVLDAGDDAVVAGPRLQLEDHRGGAGLRQVGRLDLEGDQLGGLVAGVHPGLDHHHRVLDQDALVLGVDLGEEDALGPAVQVLQVGDDVDLAPLGELLGQLGQDPGHGHDGPVGALAERRQRGVGGVLEDMLQAEQRVVGDVLAEHLLLEGQALGLVPLLAPDRGQRLGDRLFAVAQAPPS